MRIMLLVATYVALTLPIAFAADTKKPDNAADEKAIRATADEFTKAFNAADAKALGALWAEDAEYTDESGRSFRGRAAIEKEYADLFKQHPGATMSVAIESVRFLGPDTAIEKGVAKVKSPQENAEAGARYTVVHAKRDGKWAMAVGHESPYVAASNDEYLKQLEWLLGDWSPDTKDAALHIKFEWLANKNFIKSTFTDSKDSKDGKPAESGVQIIGWNPKLGRIVSWHFDANGGFGNDIWTKDDAKWVIEAVGIHRDGSESGSINILTPLDANSFTWQSINRTLDGVRLSDNGPLKFVKPKAGK